MINYKWRAVMIADDPTEPGAWDEVNRLCQEGWEVTDVQNFDGCMKRSLMVYLRNAMGFYTHTQTCPTCNKPVPK